MRTGLRFFITGEPVDFPFDELAFAPEAVHDLHLLGTAGEGAQKPVLPCNGFIHIAAIDERKQRKGCVA